MNRLPAAFLSGLIAIALIVHGCGAVDPGSTLPSEDSLTQAAGILGTLQDTDKDGLPDMYDPDPANPDANDNSILDGYDPAYNKDLLMPYDPGQEDLDSDGDGIIDRLDASPLDPDANGNGIPDGFETDFDGDGLVDALDHYPDIADANCNGILDGEDPDYDNTIDYPAQIRGGEIVCGGSL